MQLGKVNDRSPLKAQARERKRQEAWRRRQERKQQRHLGFAKQPGHKL